MPEKISQYEGSKAGRASARVLVHSGSVLMFLRGQKRCEMVLAHRTA